jgi:hypothetical protein
MNLSDDWAEYGDDEAIQRILGPEVTSSQASFVRLDVVKQLLSRNGGEWLRRLGQKGIVRLAAFSRKPSPLGADIPRGKQEGYALLVEAANALDATAEGSDETHLANAINEAVLDLRGRRIAAIVVLSDWQETGGDTTLADLPALLVQPDTRTAIPVMAVGIGSPTWPRDAALLNLTGPDRVLVRDKAQFAATLVGQGIPEGTRMHVDVFVDGVRVGSEYPVLEKEGRRQQIFVEHRFPAPGSYTVELRLLPYER